MDNENRKMNHTFESDSTQVIDTTQRARNRTVMLTPDVTGEVRSRLIGNPEPQIKSDHMDDLPPSIVPEDDWGSSVPQQASVPETEEDADDDAWLRPIESGLETHEDPEPENETPWSAKDTYSAPSEVSSLLSREEPQEVPEIEDEPEEPLHEEPEYHAEPVPVPTHVPVMEERSYGIPKKIDIEQREEEMSNATERMHYKTKTKLVGFLVTYDGDPLGSYVELRSGRIIVTSEAEGNGNFFVVKDDSVSPMHAIMRVTEKGEVQVLDQLSENGTRVICADSGEEIQLSGEKSNVSHGDVIVFGDRSYKISLVRN